MALQCFVDAFNIGTGAVGTTVVRTGYGFQPKACLYFWSGNLNATDVSNNVDLKPGFGVACTPTDRCCVTTQTDTGASTMSTGRYHTAAACLASLTASTVLDGLADLESFDAGGQTLVIDDPFVANLRIHALALGGSDLTNVATFQCQAPLTTGNADVTSLAFQPDALILFSVGMTTAPPGLTTTHICTIGLATDTGQSVLAWYDTHNVPDTANGRYGRTGECLALASSASALAFRASFVSFLSNGFRLNWLEVDGSTQPYVFGLALKGGSFLVGDLTTQTNTTTPMAEAGFGFAPTGALLLSHTAPASTQDTMQTTAQVTIGAMSSPTNRGAQGWIVQHAAITAVAACRVEHDGCYAAYTDNDRGTLAGILDIQSVDSGGFTAIMDVADTAQRLVTYLAVGDAVGATVITMPAEAGTLTLAGSQVTPDVVAPGVSGTLALTGTAVLPRLSLVGGSGSASLTGAAMVPALTLPVAGGTQVLAGMDASLTRAQRLSAEAGSRSLTGTAVILRKATRLLREVGTAVLTGTASSLHVTLGVASGTSLLLGTASSLRLTLDAGLTTGTLTGTPAILRHTARLSATPQALTLTGTATALHLRLAAASGSALLAGVDVPLRVTLAANAGSSLLVGSSAGFIYGSALVLVAEPCPATLVGTAVTLRTAAQLRASLAALTLTGTPATVQTTLNGSAGSGILAGTTASLALQMPVGTDSSTVTGSPATLRTAARLLATAGTATLVGTSALLRYGQGLVLLADPGTALLAGTGASLRTTRRCLTDAGLLVATGTATIPHVTLLGGVGGGALTGQDVTLSSVQHNRMSAEPGILILTGTAATLRTAYVCRVLAGSLGLEGMARVLRTLLVGAEGTLVMTGGEAQLLYGQRRALVADPGTCLLVGLPVTCVYSAVPPVIEAEGGPLLDADVLVEALVRATATGSLRAATVPTTGLQRSSQGTPTGLRRSRGRDPVLT